MISRLLIIMYHSPSDDGNNSNGISKNNDRRNCVEIVGFGVKHRGHRTENKGKKPRKVL